MSSPDEEIAGQVFKGCGEMIIVVACILMTLGGFVALIVHFLN